MLGATALIGEATVEGPIGWALEPLASDPMACAVLDEAGASLAGVGSGAVSAGAVGAGATSAADFLSLLARRVIGPSAEMEVRVAGAAAGVEEAVGVTTGGGEPTAWVTGACEAGPDAVGVGAGIGGVGGAVVSLMTGALARALAWVLVELEPEP